MKHFIIWLLYFIQGLTCTEQNFITKAGAQRTAAEQGIMIVAPDTSPRKIQFFFIKAVKQSYDRNKATTHIL